MRWTKRKTIKVAVSLLLIISGGVICPYFPTSGQSIDAIQQQIDQTNNQIASLEANINDLQSQSQTLLSQRNSVLANEITINSLLSKALQKEAQINILINNFTNLQHQAQVQVAAKEQIKNAEFAKLYEATQENDALLFLASNDAQSLLYNFAFHESDVQTQKNDIAQLTIQITTLQQSLDAQMAEKKVQDQQIVSLQKQKQQLQSQLAIAQSKVNANKNAVSQGQHSLVSLQQQYGQLSSQEQAIIAAKTATGFQGSNSSFVSSTGNNIQSSQNLASGCTPITNVPTPSGTSSTPNTFSVVINGKNVATVEGPIAIHPNDINTNATIRGNGHTGCYSGVVEFRGDTDMSFINQTSIENYVEGIGEMPSSWLPQALATQAVAARTYALYQKHSGTAGANESSHHYDLNDTTAYQVYLGFQGGVKFQAGVATYAQVLTSNNQLIQAFFSANNGGFESHVTGIWPNGADQTYLQDLSDSDGGVQYNNYPDPLGICPVEFSHTANPKSWGGTDGILTIGSGVGSFNDIAGMAIQLMANQSVDPNVDYSSTLASKIGNFDHAGFTFNNSQGGNSTMNATQLYNAVINNGGNAGRTTGFIVYGQDGRQYSINPENFYKAYAIASPGKDYFTSHAWYFVNEGSNVQFFNFAYGHTIGMSQCGAEGRAAAGQSFQTILAKYYQGTKLIQDADITAANPANCLLLGSNYINNDSCIRVGISGYGSSDNAITENGPFSIFAGANNQQVYSGNTGDIIEIIQN